MAYKTIAVSPGEMVEREADAAEAITPGHLVEVNSSGNLIKHNSAGVRAQKSFALENDIVGDGIGDAYSANDRAKYAIFSKGSEVLAWLSAGDNVAIGDYLESNGDGLLRKVVDQNLNPSGAPVLEQENFIGIAREAKDLSVSGAVDSRILIEVL